MTEPLTSIVVLTGAGISAESGIQTFRAADGLWENHRVEEVATPEGFAANPHKVHAFYNARRRQLLSPEIGPNPAHRALAALEHRFAGEFLLVTQNIDDLHERAGSNRLRHMHGELLKMRCALSGQCFPLHKDLLPEQPCPCCNRERSLRPHVVWFGEMPLYMDEISQALARCQLFIAVGTSAQVYPAAGFVGEARRGGAHSIEVNIEASSRYSDFAEHRRGRASESLPALCEDILSGVYGAPLLR